MKKHTIGQTVRVSTLFLAIIFFAGCGGSSNPETYSAAIAEARIAAREAMAESEASALSLALVDGQRVIWTESLERTGDAIGKAARPDAMFGIGSVSKMFATIAVMKLVEQGKVSLDEPLVTYLPDFSMLSPQYRDITERMLLNHAAGFPGGDLRSAVTATPFAGFAAQVMEGMKVQRLKHAPGYMSVYSNDGFTMVENLVKDRTGTPFPDFVQQEILTPLEMTNSRYATEPLPDGSYARPYTGESVQPYSSLNMYATGGLYATAADMGKLAMMVINGGLHGSQRILSAGSLAAMGQDQTLGSFNPVPSDKVRFGLGWDTVAQAGLNAVGIRGWQKGGSIDGAFGAMYRATMIVAPDARLGAVVMMASNKISSDIVEKVAERILLRALVDRGLLEATPPALPQNPLPVIVPAAEEASTFSGFYASTSAVYRLTFGTDNAILVEKYDGVWKPEYAGFRKRSDGWYAADGDSIKALRLLTRAGRSYIALRTRGGAGHYATPLLLAQRIDAKNPISPVWRARLAATWLPVNESLFASFPDLTFDPRLALGEIDDLQGYHFAGAHILCDMIPPSDTRLDGMFLQIPQVHGRDLVDLAVETRDNQEWLRSGSTLYRPLSGVPFAAAGPTTAAIGSEGHAEWRGLPAHGMVSISGATAWKLFDGEFNQIAFGRGSGSAIFSGGGNKYLMLFGAKGATISLNLAVAP
jgi:CubicO group peptidase (beta-lactamase class C family)